MLTITRALAKSIRTLFAQTLGLSPAQLPRQAVTLRGNVNGLTIRTCGARFAVEYALPDAQGAEEITVSLQLFKDVEGSKPEPVNLSATSDGQVIAHWTDGVIPQSTTHALLTEASSFPSLPTDFVTMPPDFLARLADAVRTTDRASTRYALGFVELRGDGAMLATDGRQALKQTGFPFPWEGSVLVPGTMVFSSKELAAFAPAQLGKTEDHVVIRCGPWTFWLAIEKEARFPRVDDVIPAIATACCTVELAEGDRHFLAANLCRLPQAADQNRPVTVELNGCIVVRAQAGEEQPPTELELSCSRKLGGHSLSATNRRFLQRAAELNLPTLCTFEKNDTFLCYDGHRQYLWMGLDSSAVVRASPNARRIASADVLAPRSAISQSRSSIVRKRTTPAATLPEKTPPVAMDAAKQPTPIEQATQLHAALRTALMATGALVRALRKQKKQDRLVKSTLASLRELQNVA